MKSEKGLLTRLGAIILGLGSTVIYLLSNPFAFLPGPVAPALSAIPVGLVFYGVTSLSWRTAILIAGGVGLGLAMGDIIGAIGLVG